MSIKYCASEIKTFRVLNPGMPSIGTSAAWAGRSEWSLRSSQFALGKVPKYLPFWTYRIHEGTKKLVNNCKMYIYNLKLNSP